MSNNNQAQLHSRISSLLISRRLTRPRVAPRYSARTSSYLNNSLTSYRQGYRSYQCSDNNNYVYYEYINVTESGRGNPKFSGALRAPVAEHPFLNF